jgi:hypothetical protein
MAGDMSTAAEIIELIIAKAPQLRKAGVQSVELDEVSFTLAPADPPDATPTADDGEDDEVDALHDPATFGRRKTVPGRRRQEKTT